MNINLPKPKLVNRVANLIRGKNKQMFAQELQKAKETIAYGDKLRRLLDNRDFQETLGLMLNERRTRIITLTMKGGHVPNAYEEIENILFEIQQAIRKADHAKQEIPKIEEKLYGRRKSTGKTAATEPAA